MENFSIGEREVELLALGAAFLGTGGGGDPLVGKLMLRRYMEGKGSIEIVDGSSGKDEFVLGSAMMGAPIVMIEKVPGGGEAVKALKVYSQIAGRKVDFITPLEIGGINSIIPLIVSIQTGIPVLDGDGMGRAFPELQMTTFYADGIPVSPVVVFDERGNVSVVQGVDGYWSEKIARVITVRYGGSAYIALHGMELSEYSRSAVLGSLSTAIQVGERLASKNIDSLRDLLHCVHLFKGKVIEVYRRVERGFSKGYVVLEGADQWKGKTMRVDFQNEFLIAKEGDKIVATVPDLISFVDAYTLTPVTTDRVRYGQRLVVLGTPSHPKLRSTEMLKYVSPRAFGYDVNFTPLGAS